MTKVGINAVNDRETPSGTDDGILMVQLWRTQKVYKDTAKNAMIIAVKIPLVPKREIPPGVILKPLTTVASFAKLLNKTSLPSLIISSGKHIKKANTANNAPLIGATAIFSSVW